MELDDLKKSWQESQPVKPLNINIMELIRNKNNGPIASLKKSFIRQIGAMIVVSGGIIITATRNTPNVLNSVILWYYVVFCLGVILFAYYNYRMVSRLESMDTLVKSNLEQQLAILKTRMKWKRAGLLTAIFIFVLLLEILPHFQHYRMLARWHSVSPVIRFSGYAAFLVGEYFLINWINKSNSGKHLQYLNDLTRELQ